MEVIKMMITVLLVVSLTYSFAALVLFSGIAGVLYFATLFIG